LQTGFERFQVEQPAVLDDAERDAIRRLAADIPALWQALTTTAAGPQAVIRQAVDQAVPAVHGQSERLKVELHWVGGHVTKETLVRPVARLEQSSYNPQLLARVAELYVQDKTLSAIAEQLNAEGCFPAKRRQTFNENMVKRCW
jgi:sugar diacid utilization regulator